MTNLVSFLVIGLALAVLPNGRASADWKQVTKADFDVTAAQIGYPGADAAILLKEGVLDDNGSAGTNLKMYVRIKIFSDAGRRFADVQLPYRVDLGKITDVQARTIRPDGSTIKVERRDIFDKLLLNTAHSIWRAKTFSLPSVVPGSIIEYRYSQNYPAGFRYFELDLQSELFIKDLVYKIHPEQSSALDLRWVTFNANDTQRFAPKWDGTYNIKATNIEPFSKEPLMPPEQAVKMWGWIYYSKDEETDPEKYWLDYGRKEYDRVTQETRTTRTIKRVVDALITPTEPKEEKIAKIYAYVQKEIHLLNPGEAAAPGLKPNSDAEDTISRRYGSPRDVNRLFVAMLRTAGIDAGVAELTTRDDNFFHYSFADALQLNGEVAFVPSEGGKIDFYDPGSIYCPLSMLAWQKEGLSALLLDNDSPKFVKTPIAPAPSNQVERELNITPFGDGRVKVSVTEKMTGHKAIDFREEFGSLRDDILKKRIAARMQQNVAGGTVDEDSVSVDKLDSPSGDVTVSYAFVAPAFAPPTDTRILLRPALLGRKDESLLTALERVNPVYFRYPWAEVDRMTVVEPAGYSIEQIPETGKVNIGAAVYESSYQERDGNVICGRKMTVDGIFFAQSEYGTLKSFFDQVHQNDRTVISLKRN